jgi:NADH dehydrogenase
VPTRRAAHARSIQFLPTTVPLPCDVHDDAQLARVLDGHDAVVNLIAILHGSAAQFDKVHVQLPQRLAAACRVAGLRRCVHVSALGADAEAPSDYLRSKAAGEETLRSAPLDLTLMRPSVIFGRGDRFLNLCAALQSMAPVMPLAAADARFQPVWVEDVAEAIVRSLNRPDTIGQTYECAGPQVYTLGDLVNLAGRLSGHERRVVPLPTAIGRFQARLMELMPGEPLMSRDNIRSMQIPNVATGKLPGLEALGVRPSAGEAVVPTYLKSDAGISRLNRRR